MQLLLIDLDRTLIDDDRAIDAVLKQMALRIFSGQKLEEGNFVGKLKQFADELFLTGQYANYFNDVGVSAMEALSCKFQRQTTYPEGLKEWVLDFQLRVWERVAGVYEGIHPPSGEMLRDGFVAEVSTQSWCYPDARPFLLRMAGRLPICLVTNGLDCLQRDKLKKSALDGFVNAVLVSSEIGRGKPNPAIFRAAAEIFGVPVSSALMIGDNYDKDIVGAKDAGARAIWLNRDGGSVASYGCPQVQTLLEIDDHLIRSQCLQ